MRAEMGHRQQGLHISVCGAVCFLWSVLVYLALYSELGICLCRPQHVSCRLLSIV